MRTNKRIDANSDVSYLILYSSFLNNLGLLNGKMGIIIFFYHYASFTGCKRYNKFADELIQELYSEVSIDLPLDFANGLCGIAWGITYLVINNFVKATDDTLDEFDERIMGTNVERIKDNSLERGLAGVAYYAMSRYYCQSLKSKISKEYIDNLLAALLMSQDHTCMEIYNNYQNGKYEDSAQIKKDLVHFLAPVKQIRHIIPSSPLSLNGVAGYKLKQILRKEKNGFI